MVGTFKTWRLLSFELLFTEEMINWEVRRLALVLLRAAVFNATIFRKIHATFLCTKRKMRIQIPYCLTFLHSERNEMIKSTFWIDSLGCQNFVITVSQPEPPEPEMSRPGTAYTGSWEGKSQEKFEANYRFIRLILTNTDLWKVPIKRFLIVSQNIKV